MVKSNACIMTLNKSLSADTIRALNVLSDAVNEYFNCTTKAYSSIKPLLSQLGGRLKENSLVIVAAEPTLFYSAKEVFCQALSLRCENCDDVIASLPTSYFPKSEREYKIVTGFPKGSDVLFTANGLFSGFCIAAGTQRIVFAPLDEKLITAMLSSSLKDIFGRIADENNIVVSDINADETEEIEEAPAVPQDTPADIPISAASAPESSEPVTIQAPSAPASVITSTPEEKSESAKLLESASEMLEALKESDSTIAFALSGPYKSLKGLVKALPGSTNTVTFDSEEPEKWTSGQFNDYFASLAKKTFENCGTDFAGALSTLYTDASGKFMFYVVADENGAKITKVSGDEANAIVYKCVTGLISAVTKRATDKSDDLPKAKKSGKVVKSSTPLIIAAIMLILAVIASAAVAYFMGSRNPSTEPTTAIVEYQPEVTETEPETEAPSEESSEPVSYVEETVPGENTEETSEAE